MGTELEEHPGHRDPVPWQAQSGRDRGDAATGVHAHQVRVWSQEYAAVLTVHGDRHGVER